MNAKIKKIVQRGALALVWLAIIAALLVSPAQPAINRLATDGLTSPIEARSAAAFYDLKSASPCLHGHQLAVFLVVNPADRGKELDSITRQVIELAKQGAQALIPFHGQGPLDWTFEIQVNQYPGDLANAEREEVVLAALGRSGSSNSAYMEALKYANTRQAEGWDGVTLSILPNAAMVKENWGLAYINGPYFWFPTRNTSFYWNGQARPIAALVFVHELLHHYGALDLYGLFSPEARSGIDWAANGPRELADGIMRFLPSKLSELSLAKVTQNQVFGLDDDSDGWRNPLDVPPELKVTTIGEGAHRLVNWKASGGSYQPKNPGLPIVQLNQVTKVKVWKKADGGKKWQAVANQPTTLVLAEGEEVAIQATNSAGNQTSWCYPACPNPWPEYGTKIFLPLVFKNKN